MAPDRDIIVAPATAPGGAIAVIRISGEGALPLCDRIFRGRSPLAEAAGYTLHYGRIVDGERIIDDVLAAVFRAPRSYTGEDSVEISCHGSSYIVAEILRLLLAAGARMAQPGEFTIRAYLGGKLDLAQAEAVADLIAASSRAAHTLATTQMRGGYSQRLEALRDRLLNLCSLLELELDFSEEDVEFADRAALDETMEHIGAELARLQDSFALGNALKEGVSVALVGAPNAGKSTLLNRLLEEDRALVSEIAGTTRDVIEAHAHIDGVLFRFLDTAGLRATDDRLERLGIERTKDEIRRARIVVRLIDASEASGAVFQTQAAGIERQTEVIPAGSQVGTTDAGIHPSAAETTDTIAAPDPTSVLPDFALRADQTLLTVFNKMDIAPASCVLPERALGISAQRGEGIDRLRKALRAAVDTEILDRGDTVVSNSRHYEALVAAREALERARDGLARRLPADLLSEELRPVIHSLGSITGRGAIAPDEILENIFSKFCIGK